jgi:nanoRNase/pAp phosphatase (c-di-AMP/oligoRNAs hydrolase)
VLFRSSYFGAYRLAYERARLHGDGAAVVVDMGPVYAAEMVPEVAEKLVSLEGLRWSMAAGTFEGDLYISLRLNDRRINAGRLVRQVCATLGGSAGGHGAMAGARIPLDGREPSALAQGIFEAVLRRFRIPTTGGRSLVPA